MIEEENKPSLFERISFLNQTPEKKEAIAEKVLQDNEEDRLYWMEITLSTLIATFGLLQNSVAVIIGAMLIAPLIRPMQAMSFSISTGRSRFFWRATLFLCKSVVVAIGISFLFALLIPLKTETPEILARITPNLLDLFIAIFSAIIALLALGYNRLSESVAGVAMAASLMPPLAVVGIEISLGNFISAWGSFLLFFVNFLAILLVGVVVFLLYGFTPHQELQKKISSRKILTLLLIILFTSIPLYSSLSNISLTIQTEKSAQEFLSTTVPLKIPSASVSDVKVLSVTDEDIHLKGVIQIPENTEIFKATYSSLLEETQDYFGKPVTLDFEMIRTANLSSPDSSEREKQKLIISGKEVLNTLFPSFSALQVTPQKIGEHQWSLQNIVSIPEGEFLTDENKELFTSQLLEIYPDLTIETEWIAVAGSPVGQRDSEVSAEDTIRGDITTALVQVLESPEMKGIFMEDIEIDQNESGEISISAHVLYPDIKKETPVVSSAPSFLDFLQSSPQVTPFSIESGGMEGDTGKIGEVIVSALKTLSYTDMLLDIKYIPYERDTLFINSTKSN